MLEPQTYPTMVAKALVLDDEPFTTMVEDDNPWVEGLALTVIVGMIAGTAQTIGGWLTTISLPDATTVENALLTGWRQFSAATSLPPTVTEAIFTRMWGAAAGWTGYAGGWGILTPLIATPALLIAWWLFFALVAFAAARALGGHGSLNSMLGAAALMVAPQVLVFLSIVPFVTVSSALLGVWGLLIGYRAVQSTHHLPWRRAVFATLIPYAALLLLAPIIITAFVLGFTAGGFR